MMKRRAKPILASAAIALSLAGCGWMGMGGGDQQSSRPTGTAGPSAASEQKTPATQQYPQSSQASSNQTVQQVQRQLSQRGYDPGAADGVMGDSTQTALRKFQRDQGLNASGQIDQQTLAALGVSGGSAQQGMSQQRTMRQEEYGPTTRRMGSQQQSMASGMDRETVRNVQAQLDQRGYEVGPIDGIYGPRTRQAVTAFQRDENLRASGRVDDQTLAALGMDQGGSQVGEMPSDRGSGLQRQQRQQQDQMGATPQDESDIGPREQTGQVPGGETGGVDVGPQEPGTLPDTGSEAPGSEQPSERSGGIQGNEPEVETPQGGTQGTPR